MKHINKLQIGDFVTFSIDGKRHGEGVITDMLNETVNVKLTIWCKEFARGSVIIVDKSEITGIIDQDYHHHSNLTYK